MNKPSRIKPEKIIDSLRSLVRLDFNLYSSLKSHAKTKGEITFIGEKKVEEVESQLFTFNESGFTETHTIHDFTEIGKPTEPSSVQWLNFHGLHDVHLFEKLAEVIQLDRLTLRQIVDTTQRPKADEYEQYLFFSVKSITTKQERLYVEHISFLLGNNYVISFQEEKGDHFTHIRNKIRENLGLIRKKGSDYLLSQLLDAILDNYFETIDSINQEIALLEKKTLSNPTQSVLYELESTKKSTEAIKKSLKPFKEALTNILNDRTTFINKSNKKYFRDLKNNCASAIEEADSSLKALEGLTNIYFSSLSHKMNEIMKVLTTVATIFIPLTFIAGVYGMNFDYIPELKLHNGYFIVLGVMLLVLVGMIIYFKRKRWL